MGSCPTCLIDPSALLVADASTVINLNASGCACRVIEALPNRVLVVDIVREELEGGRHRQRSDADLLDDLVKNKLIEIDSLDAAGEGYFEQLVIGDAKDTLDDGEAATIAHAASLNGVAVFDEKKATRICGERFPALHLGRTMDIFGHPLVRGALGADGLANAVFNALFYGRMRVFPHYVDWVVALIGMDRAEQCKSLPRSVRVARSAAATGASAKSTGPSKKAEK
jgi:predicted nucleic acid-binding protein